MRKMFPSPLFSPCCWEQGRLIDRSRWGGGGGRLGSAPAPPPSPLLLFALVDGFSQAGHSWGPAVPPQLAFNRHTQGMDTHPRHGAPGAAQAGRGWVRTRACESAHACPCLPILISPRVAFLPFKLPPPSSLSHIPHSRAAFACCSPLIPPCSSFQHQLPGPWAVAARRARRRNARLGVPEVAQERPRPGWMLY